MKRANSRLILIIMMMMIKVSFISVVILCLVCSLVGANLPPDEVSSKSHNEWEGSSVNDNTEKVPPIFDYNKYTRLFGKIYSLKDGAKKSQLFIGRTLRIFQHNVMYMSGKVKYYLNQNEFTDLTALEIANSYHVGQGVEFEPKEPSIQSSSQPTHGSSITDQSEGVGEGYSRASLDEVKITDTHPKEESILDFNSDVDISESTNTILHQLHSTPRLTKMMAKAMEFSSPEKKSRIVEISNTNDVEYKPIVSSNNHRYNQQMITSFGFFNNLRPPMENFAKQSTGYDPKAELSLPTMDQKQLETLNNDELEEAVGKAILSGVLSSIESIFDHLSYLDPPDDDDDGREIQSVASDNIKYDIDWRTSGCISRPRSQGSCNSCYAFAVLGLMEYFYCRQTKQLTDFSAQYMIDCGSKTQLKGCMGGKMKNVGLFINRYGIELDTIYPYSGLDAQCPHSEQDDLEKRTGYLRPLITRWQNFHELSAWSRWLQKSPLIVGINMPPDFLAYAGGVHSGLNCDQTKTHAMLLVGSGTEKGEEFWLLKNSYSEFWGEGGYFKLAKSAPSDCFNSAIVARVNFLVKIH